MYVFMKSPVIFEGQRRGEFRERNPHSLCITIFEAMQGIAQEKVRIPNTPLPKIDWLMDMIPRTDYQRESALLWQFISRLISL